MPALAEHDRCHDLHLLKAALMNLTVFASFWSRCKVSGLGRI
jgi:hypothetical protein